MEYSDIPSVFDLVHIIAQRGIRHAVISPGSRNAPLSISLHRHPDIQTYVIPDERAAAFFALGLAQQSGVPTLLCCTSGSAALNYAPAIAEAYYQRIPLLVVTADRPEEWIDQGDGQTIRQKDVYQNYIRFSTGLIQNARSDSDRNENQQRMHEAIRQTTIPIGGPVHINFPLSEPLYNTRAYPDDEMPAIKNVDPEMPAEIPVAALRETLSSAQKILVLCGMLPPDPQLETLLEKWATHPQVVILTESTSNLRSEKFFPCIDRLIFTFDENDLEFFQPDLLITIGHSIISKKIKAILRERKPGHHWHIDPDRPHPNTFQALSQSIYTTPVEAIGKLLPELPKVQSNYQQWLRQRDAAIDNEHIAFMNTCAFSDLKAVESLLDVLPESVNFHLGNSASVRYVQLFKQGRTQQCNCNRGTSGIDGCTSTAMGAATITGNPTVLLTGDMAFLYDNNAFWHPHVPSNLKIVVLNNGGGGIFRIIEGSKDEAETEKYFEAHHGHTAGQVAQRYGLTYSSAHDEATLSEVLPAFLESESSQPTILEIFTPRLENDRTLKAYFRQLQNARTTKKILNNE